MATAMHYNRIRQEFTLYAPALMTALGMLGTFIGIIMGLWEFQTDDINASIVHLLEGIKTAFITSIFGLLGTIVFKIITTLIPRKSTIETAEEAGALEVIQSLHNLKIDLQTSLEKNRKTSIEIYKNEIQLSKNNHKEVINLLNNRLEKIAELLSKSVTEIVIEALKETIADFNNNLTEQFGSNFKQLNVAVEKLVTWQGNYKQQLEQMTSAFETTTKSITEIDSSATHIQESMSQMPEHMGNLKSIIEINHHQVQELSQHLQTFTEIRQSAQEALPEIQNFIKNTVNNMDEMQTQVGKTISNTLEKTLLETGEALRTEINNYNDLLGENARHNIQELADNLASITGKFTEDYTELVQEMKRVVNTR